MDFTYKYLFHKISELIYYYTKITLSHAMLSMQNAEKYNIVATLITRKREPARSFFLENLAPKILLLRPTRLCVGGKKFVLHVHSITARL